MATVDAQIRSIGSNISGNIDALSHDRALLAQNLLSQLRNLVEAVAVRLHLRDGTAEFDYSATGPAIDWIGSQNRQINYLFRFHKLLQMSASHYTFEGDASERLMLKYYEFLLRTRQLLQEQCGIEALENLEAFPVDLDPSLREYHQKIAERIDDTTKVQGTRGRYYIQTVRPFFTGGRIYYEVTFSNAVNKASKFDRVIAFTDIDMTDKYAANLTLLSNSIDVLDQTMPITIISEWEVSIRPCEIDNFAKIFGNSIKVNATSIEYRMLMRFLTETSASVLDLMDMTDTRYAQIRGIVTQRAQQPLIFPVLDAARLIVRGQRPGHNVLRYLMLRMNNQLIKLQFEPEENRHLSNLKLTQSSRPFDSMPFCASPRRHNPRFADLVESLNTDGRTHELLARRVKNNVERHAKLYTPISELEHLGSLDTLIAEHNRRLPPTHTGRILEQDKGHVFMREYEDGSVAIIEKVQEYAGTGVGGYAEAVERWLSETPLLIDDPGKEAALRQLFTQSRVALIYGAAGTGKSTMVNYIANYFGGNQKLFLAHTNPAKDNLERRVSSRPISFVMPSGGRASGYSAELLPAVCDVYLAARPVATAVCGSPDKPLRIGEIEIECYVLEDGTRVITQATFLQALGRHPKANVRREGEEQLPAILQGKAINPFIPQDIREKTRPGSCRATRSTSLGRLKYSSEG